MTEVDARLLAEFRAFTRRWLAEQDKNPATLPGDMERELIHLMRLISRYDDDPEEEP